MLSVESNWTVEACDTPLRPRGGPCRPLSLGLHDNSTVTITSTSVCVGQDLPKTNELPDRNVITVGVKPFAARPYSKRLMSTFRMTFPSARFCASMPCCPSARTCSTRFTSA